RGLNKLRSLTRRVLYRNGMDRAKRNAVHHYNIDYRIYRLFLDSDLQYSCAYFENEDMSLDEAQLAKKRHIAAKLLLDPGLNVLDIARRRAADRRRAGLAPQSAGTAHAPVVGIPESHGQVKTAPQGAAGEQQPTELGSQHSRHLLGGLSGIVCVEILEHGHRHHYLECVL